MQKLFLAAMVASVLVSGCGHRGGNTGKGSSGTAGAGKPGTNPGGAGPAPSR
jgi:hypothetical protein